MYTQRCNREKKKEGLLFRGRYKAVLVDKEHYLLEVLRYIHRNSVKAGLVKKLDDYIWSSHRAYLSNAKRWSWLERKVLLDQLSTSSSKQIKLYLDLVSFGNSEEIERFYSLKNLPSVLGSRSFKQSIKEKFSSLLNTAEIPESKYPAPDVHRVVTCVMEHYEVTREELFFSKRGKENRPRDVAIFLVRCLCFKTWPQIGKEFGIDNYSTVSSVVQRVKLRAETDKDLDKNLEIIKRRFKKSQKRTWPLCDPFGLRAFQDKNFIFIKRCHGCKVKIVKEYGGNLMKMWKECEYCFVISLVAASYRCWNLK